MLDNVIDINFYPTEAARTSNERHRPIGLGVMGLQYALYRKGIPFASKEAVEFNDEFMEAVAYYAYEASSDVAAEKGTYSTYKGSKWDRGLLPQDTVDLLEKERGVEIDVPRGGKMDWSGLRAKIAKNGMRNSNVLAIAPTATISNIMGSSPCIEPLFTNFYTKSNLSGDFMVLKPGIAVCGFSGERSIEPAVGQIRQWFEAEGWEFFAYAFDPHFLHLDVQMGMVAEGLAVVCVEAVEPELVDWLKGRGIRILPVPYADAMTLGTNVVALGEGRVLIPSTSRNLIALCRAEGLEVFDPDVSMIALGGGAVHCMCQALRRDPG